MDEGAFELGAAVVIVGLWKWPTLNGRVAIVKEYSDSLPGHVSLGVREQFANECLFWEVETLPQVLFLRHVPLRNIGRHTTASMLAAPPDRPKWRSKAVDQQTRAPRHAPRHAPLQGAIGKKPPAVQRQRSFASAAERDAQEECDLADALASDARV